MKLNKIRHFNFVNDNTEFVNKKNSAVWRGYAKNSERREFFIKNYYQVPLFNIGQHAPINDQPWSKGYMSIEEQLSYKFIFCIEGADTATSMKWIMSSNSVCVMPKPKYETWFMEGTLKPDFHFVSTIPVKDSVIRSKFKFELSISHATVVSSRLVNVNSVWYGNRIPLSLLTTRSPKSTVVRDNNKRGFKPSATMTRRIPSGGLPSIPARLNGISKT